MKDDESKLIEILREDVRPEPADDAAVQKSLHDALRTFRQSESAESPPEKKDHSWRSFGLGALSAAAIAVVAAIAAFGWWMKQGPTHDSPNPEALARLLSEVELLFPSQVSAVVLDQGDIDIQLAGETQSQPRPADQRLRLTFGRGGKTITALTYSGQRVELNLNGKVVPVTPLIQADGTVFIVTDDAVIHPSDHGQLAGYEVTLARLLSTNPTAGGKS